MEIIKKEENWEILIENKPVVEVKELKVNDNFGFGRILFNLIPENEKAIQIFDYLSMELKKEFKCSSIQLVLKNLKLPDTVNEDFFLLNRSQMEINLNQFKISEDSEQDFKYLSFHDLEGLFEEIYNDTPEYDRMMLGLNSPKKTRDLYYDILVLNKYNECIDQLNYYFGTPLKGFIINVAIDSKNDSFLIGDLVVLKKYRRKGIAKKLIYNTLFQAKKLNYKKAFLAVTEKNFAKKLYEKIGFKTVVSATSLYIK